LQEEVAVLVIVLVETEVQELWGVQVAVLELLALVLEVQEFLVE
jgi:hypothetical protein